MYDLKSLFLPLGYAVPGDNGTDLPLSLDNLESSFTHDRFPSISFAYCTYLPIKKSEEIMGGTISYRR